MLRCPVLITPTRPQLIQTIYKQTKCKIMINLQPTIFVKYKKGIMDSTIFCIFVNGLFDELENTNISSLICADELVIILTPMEALENKLGKL